MARFDETNPDDGPLSASALADVRASEQFGRKTVEMLLAHGADVNLADARGATPLMQCVSCDLPDLPKMLFAHGAKVDLTDLQGQTALMRAAMENDPGLTVLLLAHHADVNRRDKKGRTALMLAIDDGSNDLIRTERMHEAEFTDHGPLDSPSDLPNPNGHPEIVRLLLQHGADVTAMASDGATALSLAQKQGFAPVTALLKKAGAKR
nr:ankyrin repeat domain-containing protein [Capsulimonas corticalis]